MIAAALHTVAAFCCDVLAGVEDVREIYADCVDGV